MRVISLSSQLTFHSDEPQDPIERVIFYLERYTLDPRIVLEEYKQYISQSKDGDWYTWGRLDKLSFIFNFKGTYEELEPIIKAIELNIKTQVYIDAYNKLDNILRVEHEAVMAKLRYQKAQQEAEILKEQDACEKAMILPAPIARWQKYTFEYKIYEEEITTPVGRVLVSIIGRNKVKVTVRRDGIHPMAQGLTLDQKRFLLNLELKQLNNGS